MAFLHASDKPKELNVSKGTPMTALGGGSANEPYLNTTTGFPEPMARVIVPEVSPTVGYRRFTTKSLASIAASNVLSGV
jgi:hypothetical protein